MMTKTAIGSTKISSIRGRMRKYLPWYIAVVVTILLILRLCGVQ